jgi:predicted ATPase/class 3 adenylate cyclase
VRDPPTGTVTFLFSDIEGSTRLLNELGERYADLLAEHHRRMRAAFVPRGGVEVDTQGDAFFVAFNRPRAAAESASAAQEALGEIGLRVRMGIHTGQPLLTETGYVGMDVHRAARIMSAGHGGQVIVSNETQLLVNSDIGLTDLGLHRLKDLTEPQRLWQLGDGEFPPLKTLYQTNLPVQPTPLVGREAELAEVLRLLQDARLVTLTGAGGSGKTRLALQAAAEVVEDYKDGVWWVSLAALRDPELVEPTIAQTVGAKDRLAEHLRTQETLLLIDNLEQVVDAAPRLAALLAEAPHLRVLVTSRERLAVAAEREYALPTMIATEAVALFSVRAQQVKPDFEPDDAVADICRRLDGLPLAIELAAARASVLTPEQILERLSQSLDLLTTGARDAPERHQTLRATIEWSFELLAEEERQLFARLAVFAGGCTLEAAEEVAGADVDTLQSLVEKSLLRFSGERYWMLETIREYASERLKASDVPEEQRRLHAEWFTNFVERELGHVGDETLQEPSIAVVADDLDNIRTALTWCWANDRDDLGLRLGASATLCWCRRGHFNDADAWLDQAAPRIPTAAPELQLDALKAAVMIEFWVHGDVEDANRYQERALALAEELDARRDFLWLTHARAITLWETGDFDTAIRLLERNLASYRELADRHGEALELHHLGEFHRDAGNHDRAAEFLGAAVAVYRGLSDRVEELSQTLHGLGDLALDRDDLKAAARFYRESLEIAQEPRGSTACLAGLATVLARQGRTRDAATLWGAVRGAEERLGFHSFEARFPRYERHLETLRGTREWTAGRDLALDDAVSLAQRYVN